MPADAADAAPQPQPLSPPQGEATPAGGDTRPTLSSPTVAAARPASSSTSPLPPALRWAGPILAAAYGLGARVHRALSVPRPSPLPTICIGNITAGGTGKTPAVKYFARGLAQRGLKPAVLMRGYKAQASDEAREVASALTDLKVPVIVGADRLASAKKAQAQGCDVVLLDDGFQHWRLARDLDIVLLDATDPFGGGHLLPWGRLRERPEALARAGAVIATRADMVSAANLAKMEQAIKRHSPEALRARACHKPVRLRTLDAARTVPLEKLRGLPVVVLCGIANPQAFRGTLENLGAVVTRVVALADHFEYRDEGICNLIADETKKGEVIVTTEKDAVKLSGVLAEEKVWRLEIEFSLLTGEDEIWARVENAVAGEKRAD